MLHPQRRPRGASSLVHSLDEGATDNEDEVGCCGHEAARMHVILGNLCLVGRGRTGSWIFSGRKLRLAPEVLPGRGRVAGVCGQRCGAGHTSSACTTVRAVYPTSTP